MTSGEDVQIVEWSVPDRNPHTVAALQCAAAAARAFDANFAMRSKERERSIPLFHAEEVVISRDPLRSHGYFAEYELKAIRIVMDLAQGSFNSNVEQARQRFAERTEDGYYSIKYVEPGLIESDHGPNACTDMIIETKILMNMLPHPNVCQIYGVNRGGIDSFLEKGRRSFFFITDRITETMADRLEAWRINKGYNQNDELQVEQSRFKQRLEIAHDIASVLVYLHDRNLVYFIRPDKIGFDTRYGRLKLCNFSQARQNGMKDHARSITESEDINILAYTAPEVLCKASATPSTDVYGFGVMLWEIMSLRQPFEGYDRESHFAQVVGNHQRPPVNAKWPNDLKEIIKQSWDPHLRPTMKTVCEALEEALLFDEDEQSDRAAYRDLRKAKNAPLQAIHADVVRAAVNHEIKRSVHRNVPEDDVGLQKLNKEIRKNVVRKKSIGPSQAQKNVNHTEPPSSSANSIPGASSQRKRITVRVKRRSSKDDAPTVPSRESSEHVGNRTSSSRSQSPNQRGSRRNSSANLVADDRLKNNITKLLQQMGHEGLNYADKDYDRESNETSPTEAEGNSSIGSPNVIKERRGSRRSSRQSRNSEGSSSLGHAAAIVQSSFDAFDAPPGLRQAAIKAHERTRSDSPVDKERRVSRSPSNHAGRRTRSSSNHSRESPHQSSGHRRRSRTPSGHQKRSSSRSANHRSRSSAEEDRPSSNHSRESPHQSSGHRRRSRTPSGHQKRSSSRSANHRSRSSEEEDRWSEKRRSSRSASLRSERRNSESAHAARSATLTPQRSKSSRRLSRTPSGLSTRTRSRSSERRSSVDVTAIPFADLDSNDTSRKNLPKSPLRSPSKNLKKTLSVSRMHELAAPLKESISPTKTYRRSSVS